MPTEMKIGQRVCAKGRGMDAIAHWHGVVIRLTKTLIIVRDDEFSRGRRFNRESLRSVPSSDWGGLRIATTCQRRAAS